MEFLEKESERIGEPLLAARFGFKGELLIHGQQRIT